jgi:hypothetical protein
MMHLETRWRSQVLEGKKQTKALIRFQGCPLGPMVNKVEVRQVVLRVF